jgi:hypothetical protein
MACDRALKVDPNQVRAVDLSDRPRLLRVWREEEQSLVPGTILDVLEVVSHLVRPHLPRSGLRLEP